MNSTANSNTAAPPEADERLDASGLKCPMPVLRAQKFLRNMQAGQVLEVVSSDSVSRTEMPAFCAQAGHVLLHSETADGEWRFWVRKGG